jgi:PKD repeat protein
MPFAMTMKSLVIEVAQKTLITQNLFIMKLRLLGIQVMLLLLVFAVSCGEDEPDTQVVSKPIVASFKVEVTDYDAVFTNETVNADTYSWDFGDGGTSTDKSPTHKYAAAGDFTVKMTAKNATEEKTVEKPVKIEEVGEDPMTLLTGGTSKTWVLAKEKNAVSFGNPGGVWYDGLSLEKTKVELWWGNSEAQATERACLFNGEFTFKKDGQYTRETNGDLWKEWKVFDEVSGEGCSADGEALVTQLGHDVSAWRDGNFTFAVEAWTGADTIFNYTLATAGAGAYIGHYVSGTNTSDYDVHNAHNYGILSITEDRLELISYGWGGDDHGNSLDPTKGSRWYKVVLVPAN